MATLKIPILTRAQSILIVTIAIVAMMLAGLTSNTVANEEVIVNPYLEQFSSNTRVQQWEHYFDEVSKPSTKTQKGREFYLETILQRFTKYNIPKERAEIYAELPGIESTWRSDAISPAGAKGLWQIMPATAKRFGYTVQDLKDPVLSTECALRYISFLDSLYSGDVAAVLFAYNGGEGTVNSGMSQYKTSDVWLIDFKSRETYNFAPKVLGAWLHNKHKEETIN